MLENLRKFVQKKYSLMKSFSIFAIVLLLSWQVLRTMELGIILVCLFIGVMAYKVFHGY